MSSDVDWYKISVPAGSGGKFIHVITTPGDPTTDTLVQVFGPNNATTLLLFYIYQVAFSFWDVGYAAALSTVLLFVLAAVALAQFFLLDRRIHYR